LYELRITQTDRVLGCRALSATATFYSATYIVSDRHRYTRQNYRTASKLPYNHSWWCQLDCNCDQTTSYVDYQQCC